jgi:hypothetical protein
MAPDGSIFHPGYRQDLGKGKLLPRQKRREFSHFSKDLTVCGELLASAMIGESDLIVHSNLIDTVMSFDQFGLDTELFHNNSRQTGGAIVKASFYTVGYPHIDFLVVIGFSAHTFSFRLRLSLHSYSLIW